VSLSVIRCNNNLLLLQRVGRSGQTKKERKERKKRKKEKKRKKRKEKEGKKESIIPVFITRRFQAHITEALL
jgi:hypothetical protein